MGVASVRKLKRLNKLHTAFGHIHPQKLSKALLNRDFYMQGLDIITNQFCIDCPECHSKFFSKNIVKSPAIIIDEGPHYRMLFDITYLEKDFYF